MLAVTALSFVLVVGGCGNGAWFTPDQQGDRLMRVGRFEEAASAYEDIFRKGVVLYRAGDFEAAAAAFSGRNTAEGHFNRGNALVMLGKYDDAIAAYDRTLELREGWPEAEHNRELAWLRKVALDVEAGGGTGGKLGADDVVFDEDGKKGEGKEETVEMTGGDALSDEELRALWLRNVQTRPADFLRSKFAYQLHRRKGEGKP
jgi:Ca-activated chloride channel family protein